MCIRDRFIAALIWGSSFIVMKSAVDFLTPAVLLLIRFVLAAIFLAILFFSKIKNLSKENILGGMLTGCCLFAAYYVQTWGLSFTTPGKNAFLTAVYCAIVPFLVWIIHHKRPDIYNFIAAFICILGIGCVSLNGDLSINIGDLLTLCGGFLLSLIHIFLGPSGSGKTTLLNLILGITEIDEGRILFNEQDMTHVPMEQRGFNIVFQDYALFPNLTAFENITYGLKNKPQISSPEEVQELVHLLGLEKHLEKRIDQLSGGQKQRVALARKMCIRDRKKLTYIKLLLCLFIFLFPVFIKHQLNSITSYCVIGFLIYELLFSAILKHQNQQQPILKICFLLFLSFILIFSSINLESNPIFRQSSTSVLTQITNWFDGFFGDSHNGTGLSPSINGGLPTGDITLSHSIACLLYTSRCV